MSLNGRKIAAYDLKWNHAGTWSGWETCGCYLQWHGWWSGYKMYFNRNTDRCRAGWFEYMICKTDCGN